MSKITSTIWTIEPHTEAKHAILRKYLDAWLPIISRWNGRVIYIDGFAGPGEYIGGKEGSPVIAIKAVMEHKLKLRMTAEFMFIFIEDNAARCEYLQTKLGELKLHSNLKYECICGKFEDAIKQILSQLDDQKKRLAPSFVFIDPFGYSGIPFILIKRIMENTHCEVFITFMYEEINRFAQDTKSDGILDQTFGTDKWREVRKETDSNKRCYFLHDLYKNQLQHEAGIKFVRSFKMINSMNKPDYFLFFGTNEITGLKKMKEAMWRVDETGSFQFSDATYDPNQSFLFELEPNFVKLKNIILKNFKGKTVSVEELENFILTETPFTQNHYKRSILAKMEQAHPSEIKVQCKGSKRKKGTFPAQTIIQFL